jgi:hypothetical protein
MGTTPGEITSSTFAHLRDLSKCFDGIGEGSHSGGSDPAATVLELGSLAIPLLLRKLKSDPAQAHLATELLALLARRDTLCQHSIDKRLRDLSEEPVSRQTREHIAQAQVALDADEESSLDLLAEHLSSRADLANTADWLMLEATPSEVADFLGSLAERTPGTARGVLIELLTRHDLALNLRQAIVPLLAEFASFEPRELSPAPRVSITRGVHETGHRAFVATSKIRRSAPARYRCLSILITPCGEFAETCYLDEASRSQIKTRVLEPLVAAGFQTDKIGRDCARDSLLPAARRTLHAGKALGSAFYLGRDLFDIGDQLADLATGFDLGLCALFSRATDELDRGRFGECIGLLKTYSEWRPDDAEAAFAMALAKTASGDLNSAMREALKACFLVPGEARYHWNRAAIAHRADLSGECYLALRDYLGCSDDVVRRHDFARHFVASYERRAKIAHPRLAAIEVAMLESPSGRSSAVSRLYK